MASSPNSIMAPIHYVACSATRIIEMKGLHYHPRSKALHIRVEDPDALKDIVIFLRSLAMKSSGSFSENGSDCVHKESPVLDCEFLHIAIRDTFMMLHEHQDQTNVRAVQMSPEREQGLVELCQALRECLPHVTEIHISQALGGFLYNRGGSWCPVKVIERLLRCKSYQHRIPLEALMLRNLNIYTSSSDGCSAAHVLGNSLKEQTSLARFGWQQCEFVTTGNRTSHGNESIELVFESLATLPNLVDCILQRPAWSPSISIQTETLGKVMQCHTLRGLHLNEFHLQNEQLQSFLFHDTSASVHRYPQAQLQNLSLSLHLQLGKTQELAKTLALILIQNRSNLRQLSSRLDWLECTPVNARKNLSQHRIQALQAFQDVLASAFLPGANNFSQDNTVTDSSFPERLQIQLERLDLVYYADSNSNYHDTRASETRSNGFAISPAIFLRVLEHNYFITHLRLLFCGELHPEIDMLLRLNRSGLRQQLFCPNRHDSIDNDPVKRANIIAALCKAQERPDECWGSACNTRIDTMNLSMLYHLLRELPGMFQTEFYTERTK